MKLPELIKFLLDPDQLKALYQKLGVNSDSEALLIYLRETLSLESEISIFEIEETEDDIFFDKDGVQYVQLFAVNHAKDLIEFDLNLKDKGYSDVQIAQRLLDYRINDA